jgi:hypothetical protein
MSELAPLTPLDPEPNRASPHSPGLAEWLLILFLIAVFAILAIVFLGGHIDELLAPGVLPGPS